MNLKTLIDKLETHVPEGYSFSATHLRSNINFDKELTDVMHVVYPNPFPSTYRPKQQKKRVDVEIWLGKLANLKRTNADGAGYTDDETRQQMYDLAANLAASINADDYIYIATSQPWTFHDQPDGSSITRHLWMQIPMTLVLFKCPE